jgi:hypothetical protein
MTKHVAGRAAQFIEDREIESGWLSESPLGGRPRPPLVRSRGLVRWREAERLRVVEIAQRYDRV